MLMKLTPTLTSTVKVPAGNPTHPDNSLPSLCFLSLSTPLTLVPPVLKRWENRATKYPLKPLAGSSSPSKIRLIHQTRQREGIHILLSFIVPSIYLLSLFIYRHASQWIGYVCSRPRTDIIARHDHTRSRGLDCYMWWNIRGVG